MKTTPALLTLLLSTLLYACAAERTVQGNGIPWQLPSEPVDMDRWPVPDTLGDHFEFQGEINNPSSQTRLLRYSAIDDPQRKLDITLYPIPAGWEDLPPSRVVGGHYGQVRQHLAERLMVPGVHEINISDEQMEADPQVGHVVASSRLEQVFDQHTRITRVVLAARPPLFVRAALAGPGDQDEALAAMLRGALRDYLNAMDAAE